MCLLLYVSVLIILSILVNVVLCKVALYFKCLEQLLLRWFTILFCHTHCGMLVVLSILVIMVLCNVVL